MGISLLSLLFCVVMMHWDEQVISMYRSQQWLQLSLQVQNQEALSEVGAIKLTEQEAWVQDIKPAFLSES